ncbi:MAG TPA: cytochrome c oxidase subunit II [Usitatibacter sp.]|nr:cytochrome c oxidase subunit II [Usitatibacter sp.]
MNAIQNALQSAGPQAAQIEQLWWLTLAVCAIAFVPTLGALLWSLWRAPRATEATPADTAIVSQPERRTRSVVVSAVVISGIGLAFLLLASVRTDHALAQLPLEDALNIQVTGHQWWWDIRYDDPDPSKIFSTANEIYIPVGRPVVITLLSDDVIHSLWVPNLHGKKDLIPGQTATMQIRADKAGTYRGQCAEFCGLQHAFMAFTVTALPAADFDAWRAAQLEPAAQPTDEKAKRGEQLFTSGSCMMCHAIQGTTANARMAPNLTHVASRRTLAAGTVANTPQNLAAWITDPQKIKPGVNMPAHHLPGGDLDALVTYLGTLK